jgi:hypothetical protein
MKNELKKLKKTLLELPTANDVVGAYALTEENKVSIIFKIGETPDENIGINIEYDLLEILASALINLKQHIDNQNGEK